MPGDWRATFVPLLAIAAITVQMRVAIDHGVFGQREREHRYVVIARAVERLTPANAVLICMQHSGSLRYYAHRRTLRYDRLPLGWLDRAIATLQDKGYRPYVVLDDWERSDLRARLAPERLGRWWDEPVARVPFGAALYDPLATLPPRPDQRPVAPG